MAKINYTFDSLFLDSKYSDLFIELCIRKGLLHHDLLGYETESSCQTLKGKEKLLRALVLFDKIDFESTIYDCSELIEKELISENSICCSNTNPGEKYEQAAVTIMSAYKTGVIDYLNNDFKNNLKILQNPQKTASYEFWQKIEYSSELVNKVVLTKNYSADLDRDYYEIIKNLDRLYSFSSGEEVFLRRLIIDQISTLLGVRNNIAYSFMASEKNNSLYFSDYLNIKANSAGSNPAEEVYSFVTTRLPRDVNVLPMPKTLEDVWRMRSHPSIVSFRKVMQEWNYYINNNDITAAEKVKKDIIKANKALEMLGAIKKCTNSPYTRTGYFIGGFIPGLSYLINVISFVEPMITNSLIKKYSWTHISEK